MMIITKILVITAEPFNHINVYVGRCSVNMRLKSVVSLWSEELILKPNLEVRKEDISGLSQEERQQ